jgi:hypothetical protein
VLWLGIPVLYLIRLGRVDTLIMFSFYLLSMMLNTGLSYSLYCVTILSIPSFIRPFIKTRFFCQTLFLHKLRYHVIFFFVLNSVYNAVLHLVILYVEPSLYPWNEISFIILYDLLDMLLNSVYTYFIESFYIYVH